MIDVRDSVYYYGRVRGKCLQYISIRHGAL